MRATTVLLCVCAVVATSSAQQAAAPAVDRKDPKAVLQAYLDAAAAGDVERAAALLTADSPTVQHIRSWVDLGEQFPAEAGFPMSPSVLVAEVGFLPGVDRRRAHVAGLELDTSGAIATAELAEPVKREFVLKKDPAGNWAVDFYATVARATGCSDSALRAFSAIFSTEGSPQAEEDSSPSPPDWEVRDALQRTARALQEMAATKGTYPAADRWMDELVTYCMDAALVDPFPEAHATLGIAFNAELGGRPYEHDDDWTVTVMLYQTTHWERNAAGNVEDELAALGELRQSLPVVMTTGWGDVAEIPRGVTLATYRSDVQRSEECRQHVSTLCRALLQYAREHHGYLPPGDSWCDDVRPYVPPEDLTPDPFTCPGAPDMEYGYALNEALAGKSIREVRHHDHCILILPAERGVANEVRAVPEKVDLGRHFPELGGEMQVIRGLLDASIAYAQEGECYPGKGDNAWGIW